MWTSFMHRRTSKPYNIRAHLAKKFYSQDSSMRWTQFIGQNTLDHRNWALISQLFRKKIPKCITTSICVLFHKLMANLILNKCVYCILCLSCFSIALHHAKSYHHSHGPKSTLYKSGRGQQSWHPLEFAPMRLNGGRHSCLSCQDWFNIQPTRL